MEIEISKIKRIIVVLCQIILGCVFIFSGYAKAVDPYGSYYKIQDYLTAFGWDALLPLAFVAGILLCAAEFLLGICLLLGANLKTTSILTMIFMAFMTPLTLYIAIEDPVSDCGCFGDALVISNWATFWKNVVFSVLAVVVYLLRRYSPNLFSQRTDWIIAIYAGCFSICVSLYCLVNLPIIDFRPYKNGTNIPQSMEIPDGAEPDLYETTLIYEKDGVQKEFSMDNYPSNDSSWTFVDSKNVLVKKGYEPPIHDFTMEHPDLGDITEDVVSNPRYTFLLVSHRVEKADTNKRKEIAAIYDYARANGYDFYCMTATGLETKEMEEYKIESGGVEYPFVNTDEITLKTIVRSNPGLVLIKDGVVINKWSNKNMPTFTEPLENSPRGQVQQPNDWRVVFLSLVLFIVPLILVFVIDHLIGYVLERIKQKKS